MNLWFAETARAVGKTQAMIEEVKAAVAKGQKASVLVTGEDEARYWREQVGPEVKIIVGDKIQYEAVGENAKVLDLEDELMTNTASAFTMRQVRKLGEPPAIQAKYDQVNKEMREILDHFCPRCGQPNYTEAHSCPPTDDPDEGMI